MAEQLVKRFVAPTMTRALELVQRELGPEAIILSSQRTDKGVEIVTSLEPDLPTRGIDVRREFGQKFDAELDTAMNSDAAWRSQAGIERAAATYGGVSEGNSRALANNKPGADLAKKIEEAREKMLAAKRRAKLEAEGGMSGARTERAEAGDIPKQTHAEQQPESFSETITVATPSAIPGPQKVALDNSYVEQLQHEIADMRMLLQQQMWHYADRQSTSEVVMPRQVSMPNHFSLLSQHLNRLGLTQPLIEDLTAQVGHSERASSAWRDCMARLSRQIPICPKPIIDAPGIYAFLGQTGVGKTTTIAKLAAQHVLQQGPGRVALITTDTYRVGAYDQLRTMGRILNVPVKVVDADNSLHTVIASLRQFPLILIDTAGFRLGDPLLRQQLEQLESSSAIKRVLVLACNSQLATMKAAVHAHRGKHGLHACVLTKLDESASIGEALSVVVKEKLPVAYLTDGQDIPKDISVASGHGLVAKAVSILKEQNQGEHLASL